MTSSSSASSASPSSRINRGSTTKALHIDYDAIHPSSSSSNPEEPPSSPKDTPPVIRRQWLSDLIAHHSTDSRLTPHTQRLHAQHPILRNKALAVAPMVDQSDLPFRLLCRNYGANICFTPMVHAKMFYEKEGYRRKFWDEVRGTPPEDRPLIVQLCGSNVRSLLFTMRYILEHEGSGIDGFDLNCGCPQTIAKRGEYGAFLLEKDDGDCVVDVVRTVVREIGGIVPISVKVRLLPSGVDESLALYRRLVDAGAAMLTVHGRTRFMKGLKTGQADWDAIRRVVQAYGHRIPVIANGSIANLDDVRDCLEHTGADGVMSSEAVLEYPPVFTDSGTAAVQGKRTGPSRLQLAREYLEFCRVYPPDKGGQGSGIKCARAHLHRMLHPDLKGRNELRNMVAYAQEYHVLDTACDQIQQLQEDANHVPRDEGLSWYMRHRLITDDGVPVSSARILKDRIVPYTELDDEAAGCFNNLFGEEDE